MVAGEGLHAALFSGITAPRRGSARGRESCSRQAGIGAGWARGTPISSFSPSSVEAEAGERVAFDLWLTAGSEPVDGFGVSVVWTEGAFANPSWTPAGIGPFEFVAAEAHFSIKSGRNFDLDISDNALFTINRFCFSFNSCGLAAGESYQIG